MAEAEARRSIDEAGRSIRRVRVKRVDPAPAAARGVVPARERQKRDNILFVFFVVQVIGVTVLQKFGYGSSPETVVPLALPLMLGGIAITAVLVKPVFDLKRLALYALFVSTAFASTGIFADQYSTGSLALLTVLYLPLAISFPTSDANYRRCMNFFSNVMIVMACIAIAELLVEAALSYTYWPNLDKLLPENMLIPAYNYIQPIAWKSRLMKPNAVFFLEVSFLSQYLALALAAELVLFHRTRRIIFFSAVILASFAGTGLLLVALTLPVLLGRMQMRTAILVILAIVFVGLGAYELGWFDIVSARVTEYKHTGSSANLRFIAPLDRLVRFAASPGALYSGIGAGQIEKINGAQWWPITKATVEYGFLTGVLFYGLVFYTLFNRPPSRRLAFTLAVWFSIEGALLTAVNPLTCALFSTLFVLDRSSRRKPERSGRSEDEPEPRPEPRPEPVPARSPARA